MCLTCQRPGYLQTHPPDWHPHAALVVDLEEAHAEEVVYQVLKRVFGEHYCLEGHEALAKTGGQLSANPLTIWKPPIVRKRDALIRGMWPTSPNLEILKTHRS